ncbi:MAG: hypothetical protein IJX78_01815 [Bacilli bacterium]|nr:hypothetical protein [Bacilli bacterium]
MKHRSINNEIRNINKNFQKEKELEDNLRYEIAREIRNNEQTKKDKK